MSGMRTKLKSIFAATSLQLYDIIVFVETWLTNDFMDGEIFDTLLYNVYRRDRDHGTSNCSRGGGVLVAIKRCFASSEVPLQDLAVEQLCVQMSGSSGSLLLFVSYIPPMSPAELYNTHTSNIISTLDNASGNVYPVVLGDFNMPNIVWSYLDDECFLVPVNSISSSDSNVIDSLLSFNLCQVNSHVNYHNRILDLVFVRSDVNFKLEICNFPLSRNVLHHHALVLDIKPYIFAKLQDKRLRKLDFSRANFPMINDSMSLINWNVLFSCMSVSDSYDCFINKFLIFCKEFIPLKFARSYKVPWHNRALGKIKNLRNKYHKLFKRLGYSEHYSLFKHYSRIYLNYNKYLFKSYHFHIERSLRENPGRFWNFYKSKQSSSSFPTNMFLHNMSASTPSSVANLFSSYFSSNFVNSLSSPPQSDFLALVHSSLDFGCIVLSGDDVYIELLKLNNSRKPDSDGLSPYLVKSCAVSLYKIFTMIFNKSLTNGTFIVKWKATVVTPVFKSGNKCDIKNYRPISKTSTISKVFESVIKCKLAFQIKSIISTTQHGFFSGRSTITNLVTFTNICSMALDDGGQMDVIYTDFSKAFDKVSHAVLLAKLHNLGFHSSMILWLRSFLVGRLCCVCVDGVLSSSFIATSGVPQGSILGPLLFILFINDIVSCFPQVHHLLYADDLKIFHRINCPHDVLVLQDNLNNFVSWCDRNHLQLNIGKCIHVSFSRRRTNVPSRYTIDNNILPCKDVITDLGVVFDTKLSFVSHVNFILPKAYSVFSFIRRNSSSFIDPYTFKALFSAFVRSRLEYAAVVWSPAYAVHSDRLERIQKIFIKHALRHLNFSAPEPSYANKCMLLGLQPLSVRRHIMSCMFVFDIVNAQIDSPYLLSMVRLLVPHRILRHNNIFSVRLFRTNLALMEPVARSLVLVNTLSKVLALDFSYSRSSFKLLLSNYYAMSVRT